MSVAGAIPTVTGDFVSATDPAGRQHDSFCLEHLKMTALAIITKRTDAAVAIFQKRDDTNLHVHIDASMHTVILQRANHFEPRAIAHVREPRILVTAKITLENPPILRAVKNRAPCLEFANAS